MSRDHWATALDQMANAHRPLVALDFDGTLAPFQVNPSLSRIPPAGVAALRRLVAVPELALAVVTGRSLTDLMTVADLPVGTRLAGDHGAQFGVIDDAGPILEPVHLTPDQSSLLTAVMAALNELVGDGAWVEPKTTRAVLHTRPMASAEQASAKRELARQIGAELGANVLDGKEMVELAVVKATKAQALAKLRADHRAGIVLFAGDDVTDETVLTTLTRDDVGIKVGPGHSGATVRLADPAEMVQFLTDLADRLDARP
ncbi:MAG: trehalose-phosphatase [Bifidobacteriaceae bacterium]|jgi:trehalose-phosphatase|nr:trehalose-phosphatase [Bifidobacteriaceae bacterium]